MLLLRFAICTILDIFLNKLCLSVEVRESLIHALVIIKSYIDHCNSVLFSLPDCQLNIKFQRVLIKQQQG